MTPRDSGSDVTVTIAANGIEFACLSAGPADGPLALCLHGFPDTAHTWRHLLPALADAGYRAVAPWMRGYAPTALAADGNYQRGALSADAAGLHEALGGDGRAVLIGHDWGALAAYGAAAAEPERWRQVVTMAVPPLAIAAAGLTAYDQLKRSFYIWLFQTPMADSIVAADDLAFIAALWEDWSPGYDAKVDVDHVRASLCDPDHVAAALGYYRAMLDSSANDPGLGAFELGAFSPRPQPHLYLHGRNDGCMMADGIDDAPTHGGPGSRMVWVEDAGHFLHLEQPVTVSELVLEFLADG